MLATREHGSSDRDHVHFFNDLPDHIRNRTTLWPAEGICPRMESAKLGMVSNVTNVMETLVFICVAKSCHHPPSRLMAILPIELRPPSMAMPSAARAKGRTREGRGRSAPERR